MKLTKLRRLVLDIVKDNPLAGEDDSALLAEAWKRQGFEQMYDTYGLEYTLRHMVRSTSIIRRRQELCEAGLITVSSKTTKVRTEAYNNERDIRHTVHQIPKEYKAIPWLADD